MGRPRDYQQRKRILVSFEAMELAAVEQTARAAGFGVAVWCRRILVEATARDAAGVPERRAARGRDAVEQEGHRHMVEKGVLVRGVHYFQPQGTRTQLIFKWAAIVTFIEGAAPVVAEDGGPDVEATAAALERLLVREPCGPAPAALPHPGAGMASRPRHGAA
jgi:hypothetical protein